LKISDIYIIHNIKFDIFNINIITKIIRKKMSMSTIIDATYELSSNLWMSYTAYTYYSNQDLSYEVFGHIIFISFAISLLIYLYIKD